VLFRKEFDKEFLDVLLVKVDKAALVEARSKHTHTRTLIRPIRHSPSLSSLET
jgi:hypothetical protein